jgi:hypothetical protein
MKVDSTKQTNQYNLFTSNGCNANEKEQQKEDGLRFATGFPIDGPTFANFDFKIMITNLTSKRILMRQPISETKKERKSNQLAKPQRNPKKSDEAASPALNPILKAIHVDKCHRPRTRAWSKERV